MRITVDDVLSFLSAGMTIPEILDDFPYLTGEDIQACLAFEAQRWDDQIARDAAGGKLDALAEEALRDLRSGKCEDL